jgi:hypothetical protein
MTGVSFASAQRRALVRQRQNRQTIPYTSELVEKRPNYIASGPRVHASGAAEKRVIAAGFAQRDATLQRARPKMPGPDLQMKYISVLI